LFYRFLIFNVSVEILCTLYCLFKFPFSSYILLSVLVTQCQLLQLSNITINCSALHRIVCVIILQNVNRFYFIIHYSFCIICVLHIMYVLSKQFAFNHLVLLLSPIPESIYKTWGVKFMIKGLNIYYNYYTLFQSLIHTNTINSPSKWHINSACINSSLIYAWKTNKCTNYSFNLLLMYGSSYILPALHCQPQGALLVPSEWCYNEEQSTEYCGWECCF
jgi:hypothetical protein